MDERAQAIQRRFRRPVFAAALLVIPVIVIEQSNVEQPWDAIASVANWLIWLVFAAEMVTMLVVSQNPWAWIRKHPIDVAIVVLTPPFLPASMQALRAFRLLRLLPLLVAGIEVRRLFTLIGVQYVAFLALLTVLAGGAAFAAIEDRPTIWSGLYWAVTTMTTVGYGDESPATTGGKVLAVLVMIVGVGFVAVLTGAIAQRFLAPAIEEVEREVESVELDEAQVLADIRALTGRLEVLEERLLAARSLPPE
jgi:voltage-gated potassium channel